MRPRVCLHMIVKDEVEIIRRCLESVLPWIDAWAIVDTGSSDDTPAIVQDVMKGKPGRLSHEPWKGFSGSRNDGLALARLVCQEQDAAGHSVHADAGDQRDWDRCDQTERELDRPWLLFTLDADEVFTPDQSFVWPDDDLDAHHCWVELGGVRFTRTLVTRANIPWHYEGEIHEDVTLDRPYRCGPPLVGLVVKSTREGARAKDPERYEIDAQKLLAMHRQDPSDPRTVFYIANSYRDAGKFEEAQKWFDLRATMPGWDQETWACMLERARNMVMTHRDPKDIIEAYLLAYANRTCRAETLRHLAMFMRMINQPALGDLFDEVANRKPVPPDIMFIDQRCYAPQPKIAIVSQAREAFSLPTTLTAAIASDPGVMPPTIRVFERDGRTLHLPPGVEYQKCGGLVQALEWGASAEHSAVVLSDDVLFARDWLRRATSLLEAAERVTAGPVIVCMHHELATLDGMKAAEVKANGDELFDTVGDWNTEIAGCVCRPATAMLLASELAADSTETVMGVCRKEGVARLLFTEPCLLWRPQSTQRFRPW